MRSLYREKMYICGDYAEVDIYPVWDFGRKKPRRKNYRPTSEVQAALNKKNAERKMIRLANTNFTPTDIQFNLTYNDENNPSDDDTALKNLRNYIRRLKRMYKKAGAELKYIAVTEKGARKGRYHHHLILSGGVSIHELDSAWGKGYTNAKPLQFDDTGIEALVKYMGKKTIGAHRYMASRNLKQPEERERTGFLSRRTVAKIAGMGLDGREDAAKTYREAVLVCVEPLFSVGAVDVADIEGRRNAINSGIYVTVKLRRQRKKEGDCTCRK